ncbi:MAG: polyhydroxyalkanoic acid system family protein [Nanoarchaeota archaeon]
MRIEHPYHGSVDDAKSKVGELLPQLQTEYGNLIGNPQVSWNSEGDEMNFSFKTSGYSISGKVDIQAGLVVLTGKLHWTLKPIRGKIERAIAGKLEEVLP